MDGPTGESEKFEMFKLVESQGTSGPDDFIIKAS